MGIVSDYMTRTVITCLPSTTLLDVQELLAEHRIARVVVVDAKNRPIGIISEKDVINFLLSDQSMRGLDEIAAKDVASSDLIAIKPSASVEEAAEIMIRKKISSLVVMNNELEGIITKADVVTYLALTGSDSSVGQYMTPNPITVKSSQSIFAVICLMLQHRISRVVVVDRESKPIGIITLADITLASNVTNLSRLYVAGGPELASDLLKRAVVIRRITAGDFMTQQPLCLNEDSNLSVAAKLMMTHRISGIPAAGESGKLTGIISKTDVAQAVAHMGRQRVEIPIDGGQFASDQQGQAITKLRFTENTNVGLDREFELKGK
jgi:CBS domain-containing protein